jgi:hypothetical protein
MARRFFTVLLDYAHYTHEAYLVVYDTGWTLFVLAGGTHSCDVPQLRHPLEVGGAYWLMVVLMNQPLSLISVWLYSR